MDNSEFNIIIVDDDADLLESMTRYIEDDGFYVIVVGCARDFYRYLANEPFAVAVIDIGLPDQSGYELTDYVRRNTDIRIIILTARSEIQERVKGYDSGADLYLVKPVNMEELMAAIASLAKRCSPRNVSIHSPCLDPGSAAILPAISAGETPALLGRSERLPRNQHSSMLDETWRLCLSTRRLVSPSGLEITLTGKEFVLVLLLAQAGGKPVERRQLMASLNYPEHDYGGRALNELLHKLRKKTITQTGTECPIHTHHSVGYCFSGRILIG